MIFKFGSFIVDDGTFELRGINGAIPLERRVFDVLVHLTRNRDRVVTKDELFGAVWTDRIVTEASLSVAIAALRRALGDDHRKPTFIATVHGRGYRFIAQVHISPSPSSATPLVKRTPGLRDHFVGRDAELELLRGLLGAARAGQLQLAVVAGEAGVGKTRLIEEFLRAVRPTGAAIAIGRCPEETGAPAFWPWIQLLRQHLSGKPAYEVEKLVSGCGDLAGLMPEFIGAFSAPAPPALDDPQQARFRLFEVITALVGRFAQRGPLVLALDDIHRADEASSSLLVHLASSLSDSPLLLVCSHRFPLKSELATTTVARLARHPNYHNLTLDGLSQEDSLSILQHYAFSHATPDMGCRLHRETGGNAFFLIQMARSLSRLAPGEHLPSLPNDLATLLAVELGRLSPAASDLLAAASVAGSEFSVSLLALALDVSTDALRPIVQACEDELILLPADTPHRFRFRHDLLRRAVYEQLSTARRSKLHERIADTYLSTSREIPGPQLATIAHHLFECANGKRLSEAIEFSIRAGEWSSSCFAHDEAALHYQRALELLDINASPDDALRCSLLVSLGIHLIRTGNRDSARRALERASKLAGRIGAASTLAEAALSVAPGVLALESGVIDTFLIELIETALHGLGRDNLATRSRLLASLSIALHWADAPEVISNLAMEARDLAASTDDRLARTQSLQALWSASHGPGFIRVRAEIATALAGIPQEDRPEADFVSRLFLLYSLLERGEMEAFDRQALLFRQLAERLRQPQALWYAELLVAMRSMLVGDFDAAARSAATFATLGRRANDANAIHSALAHGALMGFEQGAIPELIPIARDMATRYPSVQVWRAAEAWLLALSGDLGGANQVAGSITLSDAAEPSKMDWCGTLALLGETAALCNNADLAHDLVPRLLPMADANIVLGLCTLCWGSGARVLGLLANCLGLRADAINYLQKAISANERIGARPWVAWSQFSLARVLLQDRPRSRARMQAQALLDAAAATANVLQMRNLSEQVSSVFTRVGMRRRPRRTRSFIR